MTACEEQGIGISALQASVLVVLLLGALAANFNWKWRSPPPAMDVMVFDRNLSPPKPQPKEPKTPTAKSQPAPKPTPKPEPRGAELGVKPNETKTKKPEPAPVPKPEEKPAPEPEPEPSDIRELLEEISETEQAAPDPELVDIYRNRIRSLIERYLRHPEGVPQDARVVLIVRLGTNGALNGDPVIDVSSNYPDYDVEAVRAVIFAQPFPMPTDPALLREFQELRLTIEPRKN